MMGWEMVYIQCHEEKKYVINGKQFLYTMYIYIFFEEKSQFGYIFFGKKILIFDSISLF